MIKLCREIALAADKKAKRHVMVYYHETQMAYERNYKCREKGHRPRYKDCLSSSKTTIKLKNLLGLGLVNQLYIFIYIYNIRKEGLVQSLQEHFFPAILQDI